MMKLLSFSSWLVFVGMVVELGNAPTSDAVNDTAPILPLTLWTRASVGTVYNLPLASTPTSCVIASVLVDGFTPPKVVAVATGKEYAVGIVNSTSPVCPLTLVTG